MRKKLCEVLCICLLTGTISICGAGESSLTEDSDTTTFPTAFDEGDESGTADAAGPETEQLDWRLVESEEGRQTIQGILEEEGSQLVHLVVNRLDDLNCCLFETSAGKGMEFHLFLWGSWEGKEVQQHQMFSLNEEENFPLDQLSEWCEVTKEDIDFDGKPDLLIYEGYNGGTGGLWNHYRVMRWDEAQGRFAYYPSFPFWMTFWNLEDKQVIYKAKAGLGDYKVRIYGIVDGEYQVIQELHIDFWAGTLSYYENGALVREYDVTGMEWDDMEEFCREEGLSEIFSYARDYG